MAPTPWRPQVRRGWCRVVHRHRWLDRSVDVADRVRLPSWYCFRCGEGFSRPLRELARWEDGDPRLPQVLRLALRTTALLGVFAVIVTVTLTLLVAAVVWYGPQ